MAPKARSIMGSSFNFPRSARLPNERRGPSEESEHVLGVLDELPAVGESRVQLDAGRLEDGCAARTRVRRCDSTSHSLWLTMLGWV